jgi:TRAP-type uncharacterized transport system substrate-binding protein
MRFFLSPGPHHEGEARVCVIGAEKGLEKKMGEVLSAQGKEMSDIKANLAALSTQMAAMMDDGYVDATAFCLWPLQCF